jgi:hypothetical protein
MPAGPYLDLSRASSSFATITVFFRIGHVLGPSGAGIHAQATGSFTAPHLVAALLTAVAAALSFCSRRRLSTGGRTCNGLIGWKL